MALANERAFAVDAAMVLVGSYTSTLTGGALPLLQTIFPQIPPPGKSPVSFFSSASKLMNVRDTAWDQLDVTDHEYGHYVASAFHFIAAGIGGNHNVGVNNATAGTPPRGKAKGLGLAWNEGWATYFSISGQDAANAAALGIPNYGDHSYNGLANYSLDTLAADHHAVGEDDEGSVSGVLWNMYLTSKDAASPIQYTDKSIFDLVNSSASMTVGAVWEAAAAKLDTKGKTQLGKIFGDMNIAPVLDSPSDNLVLKASDPIPTFKWKNNGGGAPNPLDEFKVEFDTDDFSKMIFESPTGEVTIGATTSTFKPTADEWKTIIAGGARLKWFVEGKNKSNPASPGGALGDYWSQARTIGPPVSIAFVIDVTGSMTDEIGGVRDALQAYIDQVAAGLPAGQKPPTIELIAFRDSPSVLITSNDLAAVKAAVATLGASGGGDCPEPSALSLQRAVADIGPGGTILLATDASSDPGIDLSAVIAAARSKGKTVNILVSGDCNGIGSPSSSSIAAAALTKTTSDGADEPGGKNCNGTIATTNPVVTSLPSGLVHTSIVALSKTAGGGASEPGDGSEGEIGLDPINVVLGAPIDLNGTSADTATRLIAGVSSIRGVVGTATGNVNEFVVNLVGGVRYAVNVNVEAGNAPLVEVLDRDQTTVLVQHQPFLTLESGQVLNHYTMAVTPSASGNDYIKITASGTTNPAFYTLKVFADPLADVTSSVEGFSSVASQTGGTFEVRDDVKTGNSVAYQAAIFNIMASTLGPAVLLASPNSAPQGQTLSVALTGRKTNWRQGSTSVAFPMGGIKVLGVTVTSPTTLSALIQVASDAARNFQDVVVTSKLGAATETAKGSKVVVISAPITSPTLLSVESNTVSRSQTAELSIRGVLTRWTNASILTLGPGITVKSIKVNSPTLIDAVVSVDPGAALGFRTATVSTPDMAPTSQTRALFVNIGSLSIAEITGLSPSSANLGQTIDVGITGAGTHFQDGTTTADFGSGVTVVSVAVTGPSRATARVIVAPDASLGFRNVVVTTGSESAALLNGFFVNSKVTESLASMTPSKAKQGQTLDVVIQGANTSFLSGATTANFGAGVSVLSSSVVDSTTLKVTIKVAANAAPGARNVSVTTGTQTDTLSAGLTIVASTPIPTPTPPTPSPSPLPTPSPSPSPFGPGRDAFVMTLYREVLGRIPETQGLWFWSGVLARGVAPLKVAVSLWNSPEHQVLRFYGLAPHVSFAQSYGDALNSARRATLFRFGAVPLGPINAFGSLSAFSKK